LKVMKITSDNFWSEFLFIPVYLILM
jgi:hypothetical protein